MDKLRAMATFVRIVEAGSLTAAADRTGASLTSVVRTLAGLERYLGIRLLNRTTRRIALTEEGMEYLAHCRRILAELDEAEASLSLRRSAPVGTLRLTAPVMFGRMHVARAVSGFLEAYPTVRVELTMLDRMVDLLEEGLDLAIRIGHLTDSSLVAVGLGSTRRMVCASPAYLDRNGTPLAPSDLAGHQCLCLTGHPQAVDWEFPVGGKAVRVAVTGTLASNQTDVLLDACVGGVGCGRFLEYQVDHLVETGHLVPILSEFEEPPLPVQILYPHARLLSPRVRAFVDWVAPRLRERLARRG